MGTIYTLANEPAISAAADADKLVAFDDNTGRIGSMTAAVLKTYMAAGIGVVDTTATQLSVTQASHAGKVVTVSSAVPIAITLPQATGTGAIYRFVFLVAATATSSTISVANATDVMTGVAISPVTGTAANIAKATSATSDRVSLNGTTTGGHAGSIYEFIDIKTGVFHVLGIDTSVSTTTTPFSAAV